MTRDDLQKLIGGYATGSLTEAEKQQLFEAALDDQELFEQLAQEQALKEILDEPGAKQRLIAALEDPKLSWWRRPMVWSLVGAMAVAVIAVTWLVERRPPPVEIAQVEAPPAAVEQAKPAPAAPPQIEERKEKPQRDQPKAKAATPPVQGAKDAAPAKELDDKRADASKNNVDALKKTESAPAPPPSKQEPAQQVSQTSQDRPQVQAFAAGSQEHSQNRAQGSIAPAAAPAFRARSAAAAPRFSFEYTLEDQYLTLKFAADGYFSMHFSPGNDTIVAAHVTAGQTRREYIPNNSTEADIVFSASPQSTSGGVSLTRDTKTGSVDDPSRERIQLLLRFYP